MWKKFWKVKNIFRGYFLRREKKSCVKLSEKHLLLPKTTFPLHLALRTIYTLQIFPTLVPLQVFSGEMIALGSRYKIVCRAASVAVILLVSVPSCWSSFEQCTAVRALQDSRVVLPLDPLCLSESSWPWRTAASVCGPAEWRGHARVNI